MKLFDSRKNWIKCGNCGTEFDLGKNHGCPLCLFGTGKRKVHTPLQKNAEIHDQTAENCLEIPQDFHPESKNPVVGYQEKTVGSWGMFNSFFPGKAISRVAANMINNAESDYVPLKEVIQKTAEAVKSAGIVRLRGFPNNTARESSVGRLANHFAKTFYDMGLIDLRPMNPANRSGLKIYGRGNLKIQINGQKVELSALEMGLTRDGLDFARLRNGIFDDRKDSQILSKEESDWMISYLKRIAKEGYNEYPILHELYSFLKEGNKKWRDLCNWFAQKAELEEYAKKWSRKAGDEKAFRQQIDGLASTFAAGKLSLLRELGAVSNKRNDYTIIGNLREDDENG